MTPERISPEDNGGTSYGAVLKEVVNGVKGLVESEVNLLKAELKDTTQHVGKYVAQGAVFGALLALSTLPFLAFLVIGLGRLLDGNYWLSSLIVAVVCAAVGGFMTLRVYKKIKESDMSLPRSKHYIGQSNEITSQKFQEVKDHVSADVEEIRDTTKRRVS